MTAAKMKTHKGAIKRILNKLITRGGGGGREPLTLFDGSEGRRERRMQRCYS